uniref:Minor capsid protein P9 transmembrane helices domain-containing protein n=1 Tax=viral metagenome TaxID=1070528 RepID=A0A6C0KBX9_9ZZZZ
MSEQIWFKDPAVLFSPATWSQFVPTKTMTTAQALNSVVRFSTYFSIILFLATGVSAYLLAVPVVMATSVGLFTLFPDGKVLESFISKAIRKTKEETMPSAENPFMNPLLTEIGDNPNRSDAAPITRSDVKVAVASAFQKTSDMYMDTTDVFDQAQAMRTFYTLQGATIPNDQDGFLQWLAKGLDEPDYSSAPLARHAKLLSEGYVEAKGSMKNLKTTTSVPAGTEPTSFTPAKSTKLASK